MVDNGIPTIHWLVLANSSVAMVGQKEKHPSSIVARRPSSEDENSDVMTVLFRVWKWSCVPRSLAIDIWGGNREKPRLFF